VSSKRVTNTYMKYIYLILGLFLCSFTTLQTGDKISNMHWDFVKLKDRTSGESNYFKTENDPHFYIHEKLLNGSSICNEISG
ncbi:MAG: hypothetical protein EBS34_10340, partial [Flavobacteriales bacterium]|nr:hypothetical protein [Flavobacteriales bacterium]